MNPNTPPPSDDELPDERELAALYARLPKAEPDAALDAAVFAQVARVAPVRRRPRWPVALASAAVLVLAVGVAWQVRDTLPPAGPPVASAPPVATPDTTATPTPAPAPAPAPISHAKPTQEAVRPVRRAPARPPAPTSPPPQAPAAPAMSMAPVESAPAAAPRVPGVEADRAMGDLEAATSAPGLAPDDRVGEIRRLLDRGQRDEARRKLRELRRLYPHYDLPQDLRDLNP